MDRSLSFRRSLVARWIPLLGVALPTLAAGLPACGGNVVVDQSTANGGGGSSSLGNNGGSAGSNNAGGDGGGGFGGFGGQGGFGGGQGGFGGSSLQCIDPPPSTNPAGPLCPEANDAYPFVNTGECGWIQSGPTVMNGQCCYVVVDQECGVVGRPFLVDGRAQTAGLDAAAPGTGWLGDEGRCPEIAALSTPERAALAEAWARDGLMEHASVASFGRFALELLASGAPAALVADAHRAALDEVRHAKLCLSLASAYSGAPIVPGPFDFGRGVAIESDLAALAARTFLEGCVGETLAAVQAVEQLAVATDPAVRAVLLIIAEDEARHAELAWRTVAWALKSGGESVRASLRAALGRVTIGAGEAPASEVMRAHGRLDGATVRASMERALREVVLPCVNGLLGVPAAVGGTTSVVTTAA